MTGKHVFTTREQQFSQRAFDCVNTKFGEVKPENAAAQDYKRFAKRFPALIHSCGLAQSLTFAQAKKQDVYLQDLSVVANMLTSPEGKTLDALAREAAFGDYLQYSRTVLKAASWLKRFSEAIIPEPDKEDKQSKAGSEEAKDEGHS